HAVQVEAEEAVISKVGIRALAVDHRCFRGVTVFEVPRIGRRALVDLSFPKLFSSLQVQSIDHPMMDVFGRRGPFTAKVEALLRWFGLAFMGDRSEKNPVAPNDGRRPTAAGNLHHPSDVSV